MPKYQKGQSGNPKGRPRGAFSYRAELAERLSEIDPRDKRKRTHGAVIIAKQIELAKKGSIRATSEILDRLLGKPPQAVAIADLRTETREQLIANIIESARAIEDDKPVQ